MDRIVKKERLSIPVAAFQFWEQQDFKDMLNEIMDKSNFVYSVLEKKHFKSIVFLNINTRPLYLLIINNTMNNFASKIEESV